MTLRSRLMMSALLVSIWLAVDRKSTLLLTAPWRPRGPDSKSARLRKRHRWKLVRTGAYGVRVGGIPGQGMVDAKGRHVGGRDESALQRASSLLGGNEIYAQDGLSFPVASFPLPRAGTCRTSVTRYHTCSSTQGGQDGWVFLCFHFLVRSPRRKSLYSFSQDPQSI